MSEGANFEWYIEAGGGSLQGNLYSLQDKVLHVNLVVYGHDSYEDYILLYCY